MGMLPYLAYAAAAGIVGYTNDAVRPEGLAQTSEPRNHLRGLFENDSPSGRDRNYTHGTRFDYARTMDSGHAWGISVTQNMYTPETHSKGRVEGEHPYCGYMAVGGAFLWRGVDFGCSTELQVGFTGNASCAGRMQNVLHDMFGMDNWAGWHDQIPSEVTVQLSSRQEWRIPQLERELRNGWQTDAAFTLREAVGTFRISGGAGMNCRIGKNLPPGMESVENSPTYYGIGLRKKEGYRPDRLSYFLVAGAYVEYVAHDLTVDGGVFHYFKQSCSRTPWQARASLGLGAAYKGIDYYMGASVLSRTYRTQDENSVIGTFAITLHW